jgi:hypothetical protein
VWAAAGTQRALVRTGIGTLASGVNYCLLLLVLHVQVWAAQLCGRLLAPGVAVSAVSCIADECHQLRFASVFLRVQVWVEQLCGRLLAHSVASYTSERHEQERQHQLCLRRMHNLTESLQVRLLAGNCRGLEKLQAAEMHFPGIMQEYLA